MAGGSEAPLGRAGPGAAPGKDRVALSLVCIPLVGSMQRRMSAVWDAARPAPRLVPREFLPSAATGC